MTRPTPEITEPAAAFWDAARARRLVIQRCATCGRWQHPPRPWCVTCLSDAVDFADASGLGSVYSFTVVRRAAHPAFTERVPYVYALVDLDEGVRLITNVVGCDPAQVHIGQRVRACFEDIDERHTVVVFTPLDPGATG